MTASPPRILIVRLSAIGDVIHTLPVLAALRAAQPGARIGWIVEELSAQLLEGQPGIDVLYKVPKKRWRRDKWGAGRRELPPFFRAIRADGWDIALDFQGLTKSAFAAWASGAKTRIGYAGKEGRELSRLFYTKRIAPPRGVHVVERNGSLLRGIGIEAPALARTVKLALRPEEIAPIERFYAEWAANAGHAPGEFASRSVVALNPGAGWETKRWPPRCFVELGAALYRQRQLRPLVVWGPGEEAARDEIAGGLAAAGVDHRIAPPTSLRALAALVSRVALFIGGDTGPTHLAALHAVPTVGVFGGSEPARNAPWGEFVVTAQDSTLPCVPCWKTRCPLPRDARGEIQCLANLTPAAVSAAAHRLLDSLR